MPYKSEKQRKFLQAVEHNPKFAKKVGVSKKVAEEFSAAEHLKKVTDEEKDKKLKSAMRRK